LSRSVQSILDQIDQAVGEWKSLRVGSQHDDLSDVPEHEGIRLVHRLASTIDRLAPAGTHHQRNLKDILARKVYETAKLNALIGALLALRQEYELGYLQSFEELVHADMFASFWDMADHLHSQGYKDAAAVLAGSVLEQHLRALSAKCQIAADAGGKYKKADTLNAELASQGVYNKLDQKNVTSWLGLRNDAAHGNYDNYAAQQVRLMMDAVRDFVTAQVRL
jgi:hypothetical protein